MLALCSFRCCRSRALNERKKKNLQLTSHDSHLFLIPSRLSNKYEINLINCYLFVSVHMESNLLALWNDERKFEFNPESKIVVVVVGIGKSFFFSLRACMNQKSAGRQAPRTLRTIFTRFLCIQRYYIHFIFMKTHTHKTLPRGVVVDAGEVRKVTAPSTKATPHN